MYLTDISKYNLLTSDEEIRLAKYVEDGLGADKEIELLQNSGQSLDGQHYAKLLQTRNRGLRAKRKFVESNLRLVVSIAKKYNSSGLSMHDLMQEGNLGLIHAVEKFNWRKGFKFSTYASWWIRQGITRGIANTGRTIRLPVHAGNALTQLQKARQYLESHHGRKATLAELATEVNMSEEKVSETLRFAAEPLSLSNMLYEDGDTELIDTIVDPTAESPFDSAAASTLPAEIERLLLVLDDNEREVLKFRFGVGHDDARTLEEVGEYFNLTRERIRQIETRALSKLRHPSADIGARDLLSF